MTCLAATPTLPSWHAFNNLHQFTSHAGSNSVSILSYKQLGYHTFENKAAASSKLFKFDLEGHGELPHPTPPTHTNQ